jgi:hypothetical protein
MSSARFYTLQSLVAEDQRALRAEKRRIYAAAQAPLIDMIQVLLMHRAAWRSAKSGDDRRALDKHIYEPQIMMLRASSEVVLIAPTEVANLTTEVQSLLQQYFIDTHNGEGIEGTKSHCRGGLFIAMRIDLGVDERRLGMTPEEVQQLAERLRSRNRGGSGDRGQGQSLSEDEGQPGS